MRPTIRGYRIIETIPGGGFGQSFRAIQEELGREVTLKVLPAPGPRALNRFAVEAGALANLDHHGIARIYDFGQEADLYFFAMEHVDGQQFSEFLTGQNPPGKTCIEFLLERTAEIAEALDYIHLHGMILRNLRPEHLVVDEGGRARIADLGFARFCYDMTMSNSGEARTAENYLSPEQRKPGNTPPDARADIFALGKILDSMVQAGSKSVSRELRAVIDKATASERNHRYARARDFAEDLRCILGGRRANAQPLTLRDKVGHFLMRGPVVVAASLLLVLGWAWTHHEASLEGRDSRIRDQALSPDGAENEFVQILYPQGSEHASPFVVSHHQLSSQFVRGVVREGSRKISDQILLSELIKKSSPEQLMGRYEFLAASTEFDVFINIIQWLRAMEPPPKAKNRISNSPIVGRNRKGEPIFRDRAARLAYQGKRDFETPQSRRLRRQAKPEAGR